MKAWEREKIKKGIIDLVRSKYPTKQAVCKKYGITWQTLKNWRIDDPVFDEAYRDAEREYLQRLEEPAVNGLMKRVRGYDYEERKTYFVPGKDGKPVITQEVVTVKHMPPDTAAIIFVLENINPQNFEK